MLAKYIFWLAYHDIPIIDVSQSTAGKTSCDQTLLSDMFEATKSCGSGPK